MPRMTALLLLLVIILGGAPARAQDRPRELWFYYSTNLQVDGNVPKLETVWRRAAAAGYDHVLLNDSKLGRLGGLGEATDRYYANARRAIALAAELKLTIVPAVFPIGYSESLLWHDPNLAEGLPVQDALFEVNGGEAHLVPDPAVTLARHPAFVDPTVRWTPAEASTTDPSGNARFHYRVVVSPFRCYHISFKIRTEAFEGSPRVAILGGKQSLNSDPLAVKPTQDWTSYDIVFNSLGNREVGLYFGQWGAARGKLGWKDWRIEEAGPVNILRRAGTPLVVKEEASGRVLVEGKDYDPVVDPRLGNVPWRGEYEVWHAAPPVKVHGLPDGTRLRVSWYHPIHSEGHAVCVCLSDPKLPGLLKDEAKRVGDLFGGRAFMMSHDEIRCMNWDAACADRRLDAGQILADNVRLCTSLLPADAAIYDWSDMFDPYHNAHADYYLVRGDLKGSWEGLDPKRVTIVNWNGGHAAESLKFFADRGHRQIIAGYYDGPVGAIRHWLDAAKGVKGVEGVMYTTWVAGYDDLDAFARQVRGQ